MADSLGFVIGQELHTAPLPIQIIFFSAIAIGILLLIHKEKKLNREFQKSIDVFMKHTVFWFDIR
jgi:hypothetical protein